MVQIAVDGFSGPIDLLLELIDREELDVTSLSLAEVTDQYWREIDSAEGVDADTLADFISVGSRLLLVKSAALLVIEQKPSAEELQEQMDEAAGDLTELLEEHKRFKDAIELFRQLDEDGRRVYSRVSPVKNVPLPPGLEGVTLDTLLGAVKEALARVPEEPEETVIQIEPVTVDEKMTEITRALRRRKGRLGFRPLLAECTTRTEVVVLFLAVLELIKGGGLWAEQDTPFGDIVLVHGTPEPAAETA